MSHARRAILRGATALLLLCACPGTPGSGDDTDATTDASGGTAGSCEPGEVVSCACTNGELGTQACNAEGTGFVPCACTPGEDTSGGSGSAGSATTVADTTGEDGSSTTEGDTTEGDTTEGSTGEGCIPGTANACDGCATGPGFQRCNDQGELGPCQCCEGLHPLVEGDMRYCEPGYCYCGDLQLEPPVDACYEQPVAEACCPDDIVLECY